MSQHGDRATPQPPCSAEWLAILCLPADIAEPMRGDLQEEFASLTVTAGIGSARSWYWRQVLAAMFQTGAAAFRQAPFRMLCAVVGGQWLIGSITRYAQQAIEWFLDASRLFERDPGAYVFWLKFPNQAGRIILCAAVGALIALVARRVELPTVAALASFQLAMFLVATGKLIVQGRPWVEWCAAMAVWNSFCAVAVIGGGAAVHMRRRSAALRRLAV